MSNVSSKCGVALTKESPPISMVELCCGCGAFGYGISQSGIRHLLMVDIDKNCVKSCKANFPELPDDAIVRADISSPEFKEYLKSLSLKPDVLVASLPCTSYSTAGKRQGVESKAGNLIFDFMQILLLLGEVKVFLLENVMGFLNGNLHEKPRIEYKTFIYSLFKIMGYSVYEKKLVASDFGVATNRERLFVIGVKDFYEDTIKWPEATHSVPVTVSEAINGVSFSPCGKYSEKENEIFSVLEPGERANATLLKSRGLDTDIKNESARYFYRIHPDKPCPTIMANCKKNICHYKEVRPLSVTECKACMGLNESYVLAGSTTAMYRQIGNCVPPVLGMHLGNTVRSLIN